MEGPAAGADSVVLAVASATNTWTAAANDAWLHLSAADQSGTGSQSVIFTFDANPGSTRVGRLTVAGLVLTVTQAGATYVPIGQFTPLVSSGLSAPAGVAVDQAGNVYDNTIMEWATASGAVTTLVSSGLNSPPGRERRRMGLEPTAKEGAACAILELRPSLLPPFGHVESCSASGKSLK